MKLQSSCPLCQQPLKLLEEVQIDSSGFWRTYKCGHCFFEAEPLTQVENFTQRNFKSCHGTKAAFKFQEEGVAFIERTNYNCLLADPMGLGKTIQAALAAREARLPDGSQRFKSI